MDSFFVGYNGPYGSYDAIIATRNLVYGPTNHGAPYVHPQNICPARIVIGLKGYNEMGQKCEDADDFLCRNGLRFGQVYGNAIDMSSSGPSGGLYRDAMHADAVHGRNGKQVPGQFMAINWKWDGVVKDFSTDGAWEFQNIPPVAKGAFSEFRWWNSGGAMNSGYKTEHNSPDPRVEESGFFQTSTMGYFGLFSLTAYIGDALDESSKSMSPFPSHIGTLYCVSQGKLEVADRIHLGGKGQYAEGRNATMNFAGPDNYDKTFKSIDGFEVVLASEGMFAVIQEDSGNDFGERTLISSAIEHNDDGIELDYYFIAFSGGNRNTRHMAGVGVPAGSNGYAGTHEFSGIYDLTGFLYKEDGDFHVKSSDRGVMKRRADALVPINEHYILKGLQAHNYRAGPIASNGLDRGGQWLIYKPTLPNNGIIA